MTRADVESPSVGMEREARNAPDPIAEAVARVEEVEMLAGICSYTSAVKTVYAGLPARQAFADIALLLDLARQVGGLREQTESAREALEAVDVAFVKGGGHRRRLNALAKCDIALAALRPDQSNSVET